LTSDTPAGDGNVANLFYSVSQLGYKEVLGGIHNYYSMKINPALGWCTICSHYPA
jgi:hypothetical protein